MDIIGQNISNISEDLLNILLKDRTTKRNICWATSYYISYGKEYYPQKPILLRLITGHNSGIILPRTKKIAEDKIKRIKEKAEVFTPLWICNEQNNLIDELWFGKKNVFNFSKNGSWTVNKEQITFPKGKIWKDYVDAKRLEITCGEAPYIVSRYDTILGNIIPFEERIGLLDRKIRIINENTETEEEWFIWIKRAFESIYGYEYQGDNLLIARQNIFYTFIESMEYKFSHKPNEKQMREIAEIISWNIWQMDGITMAVPYSEKSTENNQLTLFNFINKNEKTKQKLIPCKIFDWKSKSAIEFKNINKRRIQNE
ncbi:MAG: restriction endonuclease subunit M [Parvimonas sp.]|nr:restriction endonuclease subunit M [Parvimonas sp.]